MMQRYCFRHHFDRKFKFGMFALPDIRLIGSHIQLLLAVDRQVRAFGQVVADQPVDVLVATALQRGRQQK